MTRQASVRWALEVRSGTSVDRSIVSIHIGQKMQVEVRIFATPMGMTPEAKRGFADEMEFAQKPQASRPGALFRRRIRCTRCVSGL